MQKNFLKKLHWYGGWILLIVFLLSGQYMSYYHNHLQDMNDALRMQYRSIHIYILFSALIHILLGAFVRYSIFGLFRASQIIGSVLLFSASVFLVISFMTEIPAEELKRSMTQYGAYASLAAVIFMAIPEFFKENRNLR